MVPLNAGGAGPVPAGGHRLPHYVSSFVGRRESDELVELLGSARLVTFTGPGGVGKTRLAVEVAERVAPGRAFFVDLAAFREPPQVAEEIAAAFDVGELRGRSLAEALAAQLAGSALLVLDNCEHMITACAEQAARLLQHCPELRILATSQQRLGVTGEVAWWVPGLPWPRPAPDEGLEAALRSAAVQLFCDRAAAVKRDFAASAANVGPIVEICRRLEGNPLAIELAAARVDALAPADIAGRLDHDFDLLEGTAGPSRHRTLDATLAWSSGLLDHAERVLLHRLSVFAGSFTLDAVEEVCAGGDVARSRVLGLLSTLVAKSLVVAQTNGESARYRLLETVRHYAARQLAATGEGDEVAERHAAWMIALVHQHVEADDTGVWLAEYKCAQDNLRAALDWSLAHGKGEAALRLARGLMVFWESSARFGEAREYLARVVAVGADAPPRLRAVAWHDAGFAAFMLGDLDEARAHLERSLALWAEAGHVVAQERTRGLLGFVSTFGDGPVDVDELESNLDKLRAVGDDHMAEALLACGQARLFRGESVAAERHFEELADVARRSGEQAMVASALIGLGSAAVARGEWVAAEAYLREGVALATDLGEGWTEEVGRVGLAELARLRGDDEEAKARFEECLARGRDVAAPYAVTKALIGLGRLHVGQGNIGDADTLFGEAAEIARQAGLAHVLASALDACGEAALAAGDAASARARFDDALAVAGKCGERAAAARATSHLAELARADGDLAQAACHHHQALSERHQIGDWPGVADSLEALAGLAVAGESHEAAARLFGAAHALRQGGGWPRSRSQAHAYETDVAVLTTRLAADELERAWDQGMALSVDDAVAYASRGRGSRARPASGFGSLTRTERDVVAMVAEGLTNPEIADRLFVSPRTVQSHLRNVYAKLGVSSRRQLRELLAEA